MSRLQAGFARVDAAPTTFDLGDYTSPSFTAAEASQDATVAFTPTDAWVDEDDSAMLLYFSRPQNPGKTFFKGPYRFAGSIDGDATTAPTTPATIALPFPVVADQRVFGFARVLRADGRLSGLSRMTAIVS